MQRKTVHAEHLNGFLNYLSDKGVRSITRRGYVFDTKQFLDWLGENYLEITQVTKSEAQRYIAFLDSRRYLSSTIQKKVCSLRAFFEYLEETNG